MSANPFLIFKRYYSVEQAKIQAQLLEEHGIVVQLVDNSPPYDITFSGSTIQNQIELKIQQRDFEKANSVLAHEADIRLEDVDKNHYLFDFASEELYSILLKPDEWSEYDVLLSKKILGSRGQEISDDLIRSLRKQRLQDLSKPEEDQRGWIIMGYICSLLGGLLGIFIGWFLWNHKRTLPDGTSVYAYSMDNRKQGKIIFFIGLIFLPIALWIRFAVQ